MSPDGIVDVLRAHPAEGSGGLGLPTAEGLLVVIGRLGAAVIAPRAIYRSTRPVDDVATALRATGPRDAGDGGLVTVPAAAQARAAALLAALADADRRLDAGELLAGERQGGQCFLRGAGHTVSLRPWQLEDPRTLAASPFAYRADDPWTLVDALPLVPIAIPAALGAVLPVVRARLALTPQAAAEAMLADLRAGRTWSGGPTSDQQWTLRWRAGEYHMEGTDPEGAPYDDRKSEEEVRRMFLTWRMFGLAG